MNRRSLFSLALLMLTALACSFGSISTNRVIGSGKVVSENRNVSGFTSIELTGSADVDVTIGTTESVIVKADDNIVPLVETTVRNGKLVIGNKPNINLNSTNPVQVIIVTKSLNGIALTGSGNMNVSGMTGPELTVEMKGSGNINVQGTVDHVTANLTGSGNIFCNELKARSAVVTVGGSGNVNVYAAESLDAKISGSGDIRYEGNPAKLTKSITGSGSITP
jgi:Putative auto-transporter adhesin, head GIN domain